MYRHFKCMSNFPSYNMSSNVLFLFGAMNYVGMWRNKRNTFAANYAAH